MPETSPAPRPRSVSTVTGDVNVDELGVTYMHEHIFCVNPELYALWPTFSGWDEEREIQAAIEQLSVLKDDRGVDTILDCTVAGLGRNLRAVAAVAQASAVKVLACTGFYVKDNLPVSLIHREPSDSVEILAELFVRDITEGMEGTPIKAAALKCVTDRPGVTRDVDTVLRAVARAHVRTGCPIITHTDAASRQGLSQQEVFRQEGVDLGRVIIGHSNQTSDISYIEQLIEAGSFIGFDRCGRAVPEAPLEAQIALTVTLLERGYADRLVLSHDHAVFLDLLPMDEMRSRAGPTPPFGYIHQVFLPALRERGVTERHIEQMLVDNPRRYFGGS